MTADDQRADLAANLEREVHRLRAELAALRSERDHYLDEAERLRAALEHVTGLLAEARTHRENALDFARERQRELAETRAAGDALARQATELLISLPGVPGVGSPRNLLAAWVDQWRSVRGGAPTASVCVHPELDGPCSGCAPTDPTIGEGVRLEDIRDRTARDLGIGDQS